jgi:branched-chain amino acid transport system substrate-binding protein
MRKAGKLIAVVALLALTLAACGTDGGGTGGDKQTYKIAFIGALTGPNAQLVIHAANGAELAIKQANEKGDLPVNLQISRQDSLGSKDKAVPIVNQLKDDATVIAVVGPAFSGESFAANPILGAAGIPQITCCATNPGLAAIANVSGKTWFRAVGNDDLQGGRTPALISKHLKAKSVFIGHDKSAYGQGLATIVRNGVTASGSGVTLAGFEGVDPGKKDYGPLVSKVVAANPDVFYWGGYSPEGALIAKQLRERGSKTQFLGADGSKDSTFLAGAAAVEGALVTCPCTDPTSADDAESKKFVADYKAQFNTDPGVYGGEGFDSANMFIAAVKAAGTPDSDIKAYRAKITAGIKATSGFKGIANTYAFEANGDLAAASVEFYLYKVQNNKFVLVGNVEELV